MESGLWRSTAAYIPLNETSQPDPNRLLSGGCDRMFEYRFPLLRTIVEISENRIKKFASSRTYFSTFPPLRVPQLRGLYVTEIATER